MLRTIFAAAAAASAAATVAAAQDACAGPTAIYDVAVSEPDDFRVAVEFAHPPRALDLHFFPSEARPEGQSESIRDLIGADADGDAVGLTYVGQGTWRVEEGRDLARLTYRVLADHDEVDWGPGKDEVATRFDDTFFFVGHAFFLVDYGAPDCPVDVRFDLPEGWRATTPWTRREDGLRAARPSSLASNAFALGRDVAETGDLGGFRTTWLVASDIAEAEPRITELMSALPPVYSEFWGGAPGTNFATFFFSDPFSDGGAFANSFAMRLATPLTAVEEKSWSHTLGHEMMHLWNGTGLIQPDDSGEIYWFSEGVTDYLTLKLMRRAGLVSQDMTEQRVANFVRRWNLAQRFSPDVALAEAGGDKLSNWELIYSGGALFALILDAELSAEEPNGFRDAIRAVAASPHGPAFSHATLMETLNEATGGTAGEVMDWLDTRPRAQEIRERLAAYGVETAVFQAEAYVAFGGCDGREVCPAAFLGGPEDEAP